MIAYTGTCYRYRYFLFQGWTGKAINSIGRGMSARSGIGWSHRVIPRIGKLAIVVTTRHFQQPRNMAESATASQTELKSSKTPIGWRDKCSAYVALSLSQLLLLWLTSSSPKNISNWTRLAFSSPSMSAGEKRVTCHGSATTKDTRMRSTWPKFLCSSQLNTNIRPFDVQVSVWWVRPLCKIFASITDVLIFVF